MILTFPHLGNAYICVKALLDELDIKYVIPPPSSKNTLETGTRLTPETACLPLKIVLGNIIDAGRLGADTVLMAGGRGPCRFGYYSEMLKGLLSDAGLNMEVVAFEWPDRGLRELISRMKRLTGSLNIFKILMAAKKAIEISWLVDNIEMLGFRIRPRETKKGTTDRIWRSFHNKAYVTHGYQALKRLIKDTEYELLRVQTDSVSDTLRVGIVGEIYTTIDSFSNLSLPSKLGELGIEVDRQVTVSGWIIEHIIKNVLHLPKDTEYKKASKPFLGAMIGGHAQETIGHSVIYAQKGYDGIIQVYPMTCMPEIVAQGILKSVEKKLDIPVLTLVLDEMTGDAGLCTRLEAFADLLYRRRERKSFGEKNILSWD